MEQAQGKTNEWSRYIKHDIFDVRPDLKGDELRAKDESVLKLRYVITDKAETKRAGRSLKQVPMEIKARLVTPGFADEDNLQGKLNKRCTDATSRGNGGDHAVCN